MVLVIAVVVAPTPERLKLTVSIPEIDVETGNVNAVARSVTKFNVSVPSPPLIVSNMLKVAPVPKIALNASLPAVPTRLSTPVVSVKVEPTTGVGVVPLPVVDSNAGVVTVVLLVALTAVPPKVKPVTPPVVANLVATVPLDPVNSGHEAL